MRLNFFVKILFFSCGFLLGSAVYSIIAGGGVLPVPTESKPETTVEPTTTTTTTEEPTTTTSAVKTHDDLYNHTLADFLHSEVRILCWIFTHSTNHRVKVPHVRKLWADKCNKLIFFSNAADPEIPEIVVLPTEEDRKALWRKTRMAMSYVYEHYLNDYDWFMRADDDNFILMENLRHTLYQYNPKTALYMGQRFAVVRVFTKTEEGFMHGAGHILSRKALQKFVERSLKDPVNCDTIVDTDADDVKEGSCLRKHAIFVNVLDELGQKQFFAFSPKEHFRARFNISWYQEYLWDKVPVGSLDCCSSKVVMLHYIQPSEQYGLEYLVYRVHPFGVRKDERRELPPKLTLQEIIKASDGPCHAGNYVPHAKVHLLDEDEKYRK